MVPKVCFKDMMRGGMGTDMYNALSGMHLDYMHISVYILMVHIYILLLTSVYQNISNAQDVPYTGVRYLHLCDTRNNYSYNTWEVIEQESEY